MTSTTHNAEFLLDALDGVIRVNLTLRTRVAESTLRDWLRAYRAGGFEALKPQPRSDRGQPRAVSAETLDRAEALKREQPFRSARSIARILSLDHTNPVPEAKLAPRTLRRHLAQRGATTPQLLTEQQPKAFRRFERSAFGDLWQGDAMHGPTLPDPVHPDQQRQVFLFAFLVSVFFVLLRLLLCCFGLRLLRLLLGFLLVLLLLVLRQHLDGQRDVVGILVDDAAQAEALQKIILTLAQVQHHLGAACRALDGLPGLLCRAWIRIARLRVRLIDDVERVDRDPVLGEQPLDLPQRPRGVLAGLQRHRHGGARAEPLVYFAADRPNPTPYSGVIPGIREQQERTTPQLAVLQSRTETPSESPG